MTIKISMPDIGIEEVEVTEIMVKVGDKVDVEQSLITVEGEKTSIEVPSPQAGIVKEIKVAVGNKVTAGKVIMVFDRAYTVGSVIPKKTSDINVNSDKADNKDTNRAESKLQEVIVPDIGYDEVEVTDVLVTVGDKIAVEQSIITVEGEKASMEVPAPCSGTVKEIKVAIGDKVKTGSLIMILIIDLKVTSPTSSAEQISPEIIMPASETTQVSFSTNETDIIENKNVFFENDTYVHATPMIRRLARSFGVNLSKLNGTGRKGRILREDIQVYIKEALRLYEARATKISSFPDISAWPKVDFGKFGAIKEVELSRIQKISSANLSRNWIMIPHVTIMEDTDITEVEAFRKQQNKEMEKSNTGIKITLLVFVMKAVARSLEEMPRFNSSISDSAQRLILKKYIHIGIAVDTPNGLVVPVIKNVNKKGIIELSKELIELAKKARIGKLTASDMQGRSFTISSLGGIGTTGFTPIINAPEVAIIGLSRSSIKPVWNGNEFISRLILPMSLSFDHRVIDGADGARFITRIAQLMSDIRYLVM
ncbi:MAG: dihydrolipoyllysine-residue acetyltransferase [Candidatus Arsenophonus melophagi]|nr:dihydrolipoyllysine-residue acetyltransferase [Candidatus Arsenophonus melophagi]